MKPALPASMRSVDDALREENLMPNKRANLTATPDQIRSGELCRCVACVRDGQHEPDCDVHDEPVGECTCGRTDQAKGAS